MGPHVCKAHDPVAAAFLGLIKRNVSKLTVCQKVSLSPGKSARPMEMVFRSTVEPVLISSCPTANRDFLGHMICNFRCCIEKDDEVGDAH
ncbi:MAG: hypothetical protein FD153_1914 [Rhodospirillaceae bacterium]|nr:MAG: hypothetical protein FD153_1914 [Rhodospirillaceae bacterium]